jgi:hypothetical protein
MLDLITEGLVVRHREPLPGSRPPKARWVIHRADCAFAGGCQPMAEFAEEMTPAGVLGRVRVGRISRCRTCAPKIVE